MDQPSSNLADRFGLDLSREWKDWFDIYVERLKFPGRFRFPLTAEELCQDRPGILWPGFMQPDSLPLLGNGYGDWICVRINERNQFGELIHWFHGGGDWIPVGRSLAESVLHDALDQHRPLQKQMLRGAAESISPTETDSSECGRREIIELGQWLDRSISATPDAGPASKILQSLRPEHYARVLQQLINMGIAVEACSCDWIESILSGALPDDRQPLEDLPSEVWSSVGRICGEIINRRSDIGWSFALYGMSQELTANAEQARQSWFLGRMASSFSDQSVRLRLHRLEHHYPKSCIALLARQQSQFSHALREDLYLQQFWNDESGSLREKVQRFWRRRGMESMDCGSFAAAYANFYQAGWDLGAAKLTDYDPILRGMREAAQAAGWQARARLIQVYLDCLSARKD